MTHLGIGLSILLSRPLYGSTASNSVVVNCDPSLYSQHSTWHGFQQPWTLVTYAALCHFAGADFFFAMDEARLAVEISQSCKLETAEVWQWDVSPARCFICPTIRQSRQSRQPVKSTRCAGGLINKLRKGPQVSWALFSKNSCRKLLVLPGNLCCGSTRLFRNQRFFSDFFGLWIKVQRAVVPGLSLCK